MRVVSRPAASRPAPTTSVERPARVAPVLVALLVVALAGPSTGVAQDTASTRRSGSAAWDIIDSWQGKIVTSPNDLDPTTSATPAATPTSVNDHLHPIPVSVLATALPARGAGLAYVPVLVEMGGTELLAENPDNRLVGRIIGTATDATSQPAGHFVQPFALELDDITRATLDRAGLKLFAELRLAAGDYRLQIEVHNDATGATGSQSSTISVPAASGVSISQPLFPEPLDRWRVFRQNVVTDDPQPYPYLSPGSAAFMPSAIPRLVPGEPVAFNLIAFGLADPVELTARISAAEGGQSTTTRLSVVDRQPGPLEGESLLSLTLEEVPTAPGRYAMDLSVGDDVSTHIVFEVTEDAEPMVGATMAAAPLAEEPVQLHGNLSTKETRRLYTEILALAAEASFEEAGAKLRALELSTTAGRLNGEIKALRKIQDETLESALERKPDAMIPVIYLHFLASNAYIQRDQIWHAAQSRVFVAELTQRYAKARRDDIGQALGGQVLATIGRPKAALELDPDNTLALLRVAIGHERAARQRDAIENLEHLVSLDPANLHARLRLGVNLRRAGSTKEARRVLDGLVRIRASEPEWVLAVGYQELAAIEMSEGHFEQAHAILEHGIKRLGCQRLYLQLAFYMDQRNDRDGSIAVLNRMTASSDFGVASPRHLYNSQPTAEIEAATAQLRRLATQRTVDLAHALSLDGPAR